MTDGAGSNRGTETSRLASDSQIDLPSDGVDPAIGGVELFGFFGKYLRILLTGVIFQLKLLDDGNGVVVGRILF
jgi:hypothetical protein